MIEYQSANPSTGLFAGRAAGWCGWAILATFAVVILLVSEGNRHRAHLETTEEVTAVGDRAFYKIPEQIGKNAAAAVVFRGQSLYAVSFHRLRNPDSKMVSIGQDDSGVYRIYTNSEPEPDDHGERARKGEPDYYLKLGEDEYFNVRPAK